MGGGGDISEKIGQLLTRTPRVEQYVDGILDLMLVHPSNSLLGRVQNYPPHGDGRVWRYLHLWNTNTIIQ